MEQRQLKFSCTLCSQAVQELFSSLHNLSILRAFTFSSCGSEVKRKWLETLQGHNAFYPLIEHSEDTLGYTVPHATTPTKGNLVKCVLLHVALPSEEKQSYAEMVCNYLVTMVNIHQHTPPWTESVKMQNNPSYI